MVEAETRISTCSKALFNHFNRFFLLEGVYINKKIFSFIFFTSHVRYIFMVEMIEMIEIVKIYRFHAGFKL